MKITILLASVSVVFLLSIGPGTDIPAPPTNPAPGLVREVTAYNVGVRGQTSDDPCIGATGRNLCRLVARGLKVCAANFVDPETILHIEGYGECIVLDRMNRRFAHRVDIAMRKDEVGKALGFGIQQRYVEVRPGRL